ncbi:MAG: Rv3235 family protein [Actinomycetia bacterium]|jgi:hypothetical protein|nr:Rv3235 family protein [Actinomycetes bacterium]
MTDLLTRPGTHTRTLLRLLPTPRREPPYDDRPPGGRRAEPLVVQGTLALAFVIPSGLPAEPAPALRVAADPGPGTAQGPPDPRAWAGRVAQAVVEVLAGDRPLAQLLRWTSGEVYEQLRRGAGRAARAGAAVRQSAPRATVRSVRVCLPAPGVAEACAVVADGSRVTAMALRLEADEGRWRCTALQVG